MPKSSEIHSVSVFIDDERVDFFPEDISYAAQQMYEHPALLTTLLVKDAIPDNEDLSRWYGSYMPYVLFLCLQSGVLPYPSNGIVDPTITQRVTIVTNRLETDRPKTRRRRPIRKN